MSLKNEFEKTGNWLFKHRSFLPLIMFPFLLYCVLTPLTASIQTVLLYTGMILSYIGECFRIFTIAYVPAGTSGRNTKQQLANILNKKGTYSMLRHPLYLGNFFIFLGVFIFTGEIYGILIYILIFWIYYERIIFAEEAFLINKFENEFQDWSLITPAFIPNIFSYSKPEPPFSIKQVLEREYTGICGIFAIYSILLVFRNYCWDIRPLISVPWKILFILNTCLYISLRTIKKLK